MRPARILFALCCSAAALAVVPGALAADDPYASLLAPSGTCGAAADTLGLDRATAEEAMTCLTNYARAQAGLTPLRASSVLDDAGQAKLAADLSCGEFSHTPCGKPFTDVFGAYLTGATSYSVGENIAWGTGSYGTPRQTMLSWLHSSGHRENILTPGFRELGIGYLPAQTFQGYAGATLWSQEFGTRAPDGAAPLSTTPPEPASAPVAQKHAPKSTLHTRRKHRRRVRR